MIPDERADVGESIPPVGADGETAGRRDGAFDRATPHSDVPDDTEAVRAAASAAGAPGETEAIRAAAPEAGAPGNAEPRPAFAAPGLRVGDALALAALFVGVFAAVGIPLAVARWLTGWEPGSAGAVLLAETVAATATIALGLRWSGLRFHEACPIAEYPLRILPGLLVATFGASILLIEVARGLPGYRHFQQLVMLQFGRSSMLAIFIAMCVAAPILEELVCRGVLLSGLRRRYSVRAALWLSAILFAVLHLNPWQGIIALPLGLGFAWVVQRTGSLMPSILAHAMANFSGSFLVGPLLLGAGYTAAQIRHMHHFPAWLLGLAAGALALGALGVWWPLRRPAPAVAAVVEDAGSSRSPALALPRAPAVLPRLAVTVLAAIVLVAATPVVRRYVAGRPSPMDTRGAGCYFLRLPPGTRARLFAAAGEDAVMVRLSRTPFRPAPGDRRKFLVEQLDADPALVPAAPPAYWFAAGRDSVRIVAQRGAGLTLLQLRRQGQDLAGEARVYDGTETTRVQSAGRVTASWMDCPATPGKKE